MLHGLTRDTGIVFRKRGGAETTAISCESSTTAAPSQRLPRESKRRRDMNGVRLGAVSPATIEVLLCMMLGRAVLFRCAAAAGHRMRIRAFRGGGGGCSRPPVRGRVWRAVQAPGTVHVITQNTLATYGRTDIQELWRLDECWRRAGKAEEEPEAEVGGRRGAPPLSPLCLPVMFY